jgi:DNA-binding beta-propeller fold protein YncE
VPQPSNLVAGFGWLWARSGSSLWKISRHGKVVDRISDAFSAKPGTVGPQDLAIGLGSVWTVQQRSVLRLDPSTDEVKARIVTPRGCDQIATGPDAMYLGCRDSRLFRIDPSTNRAALVTTVGVSPIGIAYAHGSLWWIDASEAGGVSKIETANGAVTKLTAPYARFVVPTEHRVWFINSDGEAFTIDPTSGRATHAVRKSRAAFGATSDERTVLINAGDLLAFDAESGDVVRVDHVSGKQGAQAVAGIAVLGPAIWLVDPKDQRIVGVPR